jgi:hypothetical protein
VVTHPGIYRPHVSLEEALTDLRDLLKSPSLLLLSETPRHAEVMESVLRDSHASGNLVYDAHIAALCLEHGVSELITGDRDLLRFPGLKISNPFS